MSRGGVTVKHLAIALLALAGCVTDPPPPEGDPVRSVVTRIEIPMYVNTQLDVLFVIDNSPAMAAAQTKLIADYRSMIERLSHASVGELPDVHIGVTTTDPRDQGRLRRGRFLVDTPRFGWQRERNYDGALADEFLDLAAVGNGGLADTQPLDAARRAVSAAVNPGFLRADATLAIIVLTAGDDRGTQPIGEVVQAVRGLKTDPAKIIVAGASGACAADGITATDAPRLAAFVDAFPNRNARTTLCDPLAPLLAPTESVLYHLGLACIAPPLAEPRECNGWIVNPEDLDEQLRLPECTAANPSRCWSLRPEPQQCPIGGKALHFAPIVFPFPATVMFECVVEQAP
jgi:hypothetical protein